MQQNDRASSSSSNNHRKSLNNSDDHGHPTDRYHQGQDSNKKINMKSYSNILSNSNEDEELLKRVFKVIEESKQQQVQSREALNKIMSENEHALAIQVENLTDIQNQVQVIEKRAVQLGRTISNTFKLAEGVSHKVRQLHAIQERVQLAIDAVEASIGMKSCVEGVEQAIKVGEYEKAVDFVSRVLHINNDSHRSKLVHQLSQSQHGDQQESEDEQERRNTLFKSSEKKIKEIVVLKLKEAFNDENESQIKRFSKLFAPLCIEEEGLELYTEYLTDKARQELDSVVHDGLQNISELPIEINTIEDDMERYMTIRKQQQQGLTSFIDIITQTLDVIVSYIEEYEEFVSLNFGGEKCTIYLINALQKVCDKMIKKILDHYETKRELSEVLKLLSKKNMPTKKIERERATSPVPRSDSPITSNKKIAPDDPRVLDLILEEMADICSNIEVYRQFILSKSYAIKVDSAHINNPKYILTKDPMTYRKIQEVMNYYIPIDEAFMKQSFVKALQLDDTNDNQIVSKSNEDFFESDEEELSSDEEDDETTKYSSVINDVFFILRKSLNRAIDSQNISVICAICNHINTILCGEYFEFTKKDLHFISLEHTNDKDRFVKILKSLNNIQISSEYILKLKKEFDRNYEDRLFKERRVNLPQEMFTADRMKLKSCSSDLVQSSIFFSEQLRKYTRKVVSSQEYALGIERDIDFLLNRELSQNPQFYILTENQFASKELNNSLTQKFIGDMDRVLNLYKKYLTKFNFEELVELAIDILCHRMEHLILTRRFNYFGGVQVDKDLREFMEYFATKTERPVRSKFSRLTHITYLLKMTEVDDLLEIWESAQHWGFSVSEIKNILGLRVDFSMDQINNLSI
ncbi:hypothetical protein C9374_001874 [Naegleria lovaniensis]|uniref:Conserved oligomeric Golgi complex subunit 4 n=1 Tax=Naegleria lovaniensis TaxID=51637 RepID=A0AA88GW57_NAELO|nr:uncharacterized protein C9374_001874 [Naegleria lovaniensis]KAG2386839.1 hypothetical protein C9374_001874 [Naegleria lovaniensis]